MKSHSLLYFAFILDDQTDQIWSTLIIQQCCLSNGYTIHSAFTFRMTSINTVKNLRVNSP